MTNSLPTLGQYTTLRTYEVLPRPGAAAHASSHVTEACRIVYEHSYLTDDAFYVSRTTHRAWLTGDVEAIAAMLSTVCAALYALEGGYDRWVLARNALRTLEMEWS